MPQPVALGQPVHKLAEPKQKQRGNAMTDMYERKPPGPGHNQPEDENEVKEEV